jgi:NTP pyrophosphatase (non-canonical NTP hydrolase)
MSESITFKRIDGLTPTVESCTMKLLEEVGELMQLIGKGQGLSGEKINVSEECQLATRMIEEAFDVAQSAVTMIYILAQKYEKHVPDYCVTHERKLIEKGYLKED